MNITYVFFGLFVTLLVMSIASAMVLDWQSLMGKSPVRLYWLGWLSVGLRFACLASFAMTVGSLLPLLATEKTCRPNPNHCTHQGNPCANQGTPQPLIGR